MLQPPPRAPDWVFNDFQKFDHEMATTTAMVAEKAIAQLAATLAEMASTAEQGCHEAATREKTLVDKANK